MLEIVKHYWGNNNLFCCYAKKDNFSYYGVYKSFYSGDYCSGIMFLKTNNLIGIEIEFIY